MNVLLRSISRLKFGGNVEVGGRKLTQEEAKKLKSLANDFESVLVGQMISTMRESVPDGGLVENGFGEKIYQSVLDQEFAKMMSGREGDDLSQALFEQLKAKIEKGENSSYQPLMERDLMSDIALESKRYLK